MANNTTVNAGSGGDVIATDDCAGIKFQRTKLTDGTEDSTTAIAAGAGAEANALRVTLATESLAALESLTTVATVTNVATIGTSVTPGTGAAHLGKAEDAVHADGDVGVMALAVRRDADTTLVGATGDYAPLQVNAAGSLKVAITAGAGSGTAIADAAAFTRGSTSETPVGGIVETSAPTLTNGQAGALSLTTGGAVRVSVASGGIQGVPEDSVAAGGEDGVMVVAVRRDTAASGVSADGDFAALSVDSVGALRVTSSSIIPGTAATNLGKAEDAAHASGDTGVMMLGVRQDADTSPVSATGDYHAPLFDAAGNLKVNIKAGAGSGGTALADAATFTRATTSVTPVAGVVETSAPTLTNGQAGAISLTTAGAVRVALSAGGVAGIVEDTASAGGEEGVMMLAVRRDVAASGVSADGDFATLNVDASGNLRVTGGGGGTQYAEDAVHASGDTGTLALVVRKDTAAQIAGTDGDYSALVNDASGRLHVNVGALPASTNTLEVVGDVAHDAVAAGNPILTGAYASAAAPTDVSADGDAVRLWALRSGAQAVQPTLGGVLATADNGVTGTGVQRVTLASNSTGNIATIGTSVTPGTAAANLGKAEDAVAADGDVGVAMLAVRRDTPASGVSADGDYTMLSTDSTGALRVAGSSGTTQYTEDTASTGGEALCLMGAVRRDTANSEVSAAGDYSPLLTDANGRLYVIASLTSAQTLGTVSTVTSVTAIGTSVTPGTSAAHLGKAEDAAHASGDTGVMSLAVRTDSPAASSGTTGDYEALHTDSVGALWTHAVANSAGGQTPYAFLSTAAVLAAAIKASPGSLFGMQFFNNSATVAYVRLYNMTTTPASTDGANILWRGLVPADTAGAGYTANFGPQGMAFATGIGIRVSAAVADNDTTALAANVVLGNVQYA